ncbi:MAG: DUF3240 family protein [Planctomycetes bacterium]|nr:DUF3240 family protein [Planctomycetota bacterium]MCB9910568.1 DUF3240 family protein [Planctomycetota bacterium]MCB9913217.1 DUF3240 family protein [Planctomycetota bacterium]HPF14403.1 DUF3240 family protein [Planctomycetota bacterium]
MKCLTLYLHAQVADDALDCLRSQPAITGFTLSRCEGHSLSSEQDWSQGTLDQVVGYVPRVRIEILLEAEQVQPLLASLRGCLQGGRSHGVWSLASLDDTGRL